MLTLLLAGFFIALLLLALIHRYNFWIRKGVKQYGFWYIWFQDVKDFLMQRSSTINMVKLYNDFYDERYVGVYEWTVPRLCIKDTELLKHIFIKDFNHFVDHNLFIPTSGDPIWEKSLFTLRGNEWKRMRSIASPSLTSSKMKIMFEYMVSSAKQLLTFLDEHKEGLIELEMKDVLGRLTSDIYFATHFGIICDSLRDANNEFYLMGQLGANFSGFWIKVRFILIKLFPRITGRLGLTVFDGRVNAFFRKLVRNNIRTRNEKKIVRPDLINLLMETNHEDDQVTEDEMIALAMAFFGGGFDSVSSLLSFVLYELALKPETQKKLQDEIDSFKNKPLTYDLLHKMKYLEMVVNEALRKWPGGYFLERKCVKPYVIPPVRENEVPIYLNEGDQVFIPLYALQRDPQWYEEPNEFKPERFSDEYNIDPFRYMPFGSGPRHCIGNRYALLLSKVVIYHFVSKYTVKRISRTAVPIRLCRAYFQLISKDRFWLGCEKR